jgi:hypothetical protein
MIIVDDDDDDDDDDHNDNIGAIECRGVIDYD